MKTGKLLAIFLIIFISITFLVIPFGECAIYHYNYRDVIADITVPGNKTISLATHDQREYVISGDKNPDFVGVMRGGFGNIWGVTTKSGASMAEDMTAAIAASLAKNGFNCTPVIVAHTDSADAVLEKLKTSASDILVILTLGEWKTDSYMSISVFYKINLKVYDKTGTLLAEKSLEGEDNLGKAFNIVAHAQKVAPAAFKQKVEELFNDAGISKALQ